MGSIKKGVKDVPSINAQESLYGTINR